MLLLNPRLRIKNIQEVSRRCLGSCLGAKRGLLTLAIETSCDDTAVAILEKPSKRDEFDALFSSQQRARLLFNERITSRNTGLGGIHPIEALVSHEANLATLISKATKSLPDATARHPGSLILSDGSCKKLPDFISVTRGPGMRSNLACGLNTAKGLAVAWQIPLVGLHHMQAHTLTPRMEKAFLSHGHSSDKPQFPFMTLLISGGHSMILHSTGLTNHRILATTRDIAIGDALDKCGRILLPDEIKKNTKDTAFARYLSDYAFPTADTYSSWPVPIARQDEITRPSNSFGWQVKCPLSDTRDLAFSFTSISSTVERLFKDRTTVQNGRISDDERLLLAKTALGTAFEHLASRTIVALQSLQQQNQEIPTLVVSGGVAANSFLRYFLRRMLDIRGFEKVEILFPDPANCTDNAAMIAWAGMEMFEAGWTSSLDIAAIRKWSMSAAEADGGILGPDGWIQAQ